MFTSKGIKAIHLLSPNGQEIYSGSGNEFSQNKDEWFKKIVDSGGKATWLESREKGYSNSMPAFAVGRLIKNLNTNAVSAVMLIELNLDVIGKDADKIGLGAGSEASIVTADSKVIYSTDHSVPGSASKKSDA